MIAKPKTISTMLIMDGREAVGSISLHPNQKWKIVFYADATDIVGLEHGCISFNMNREMFFERFRML